MTKDTRPPFLDVAKRALAKHYPVAIGAFVAGSIIRGEGTPTSDIDIVVLYGEPFEDVHRNTVIEEGWLIEFFVHNEQAQNFYFNKDRESGMCAMSNMVSEGIVVPEGHPLLAQQKDRAKANIAAGPPALTREEIDLRRYMISALVDDLEDAESQAIINAVLSILHDRIGDFFLRATGRWSGGGRALVRRLRAEDAEFAGVFEAAFAAGFSGRGISGVSALSNQVLAPYGGRLQAGYRSAAPNTWKEFED